MEVDLLKSFKRCSSAPIFMANNKSHSTNSHDEIDSKNNNFEEKLSSKLNFTKSKVLLQDNVISMGGIVACQSEKYSKLLCNFSSNSDCRSPIRNWEVSPAPCNIFAPRVRRYSASYAASVINNNKSGLRLTPRVSQLRQEECVDANSREVKHERQVHSAMQMSQSWEDLTLVTENKASKLEDFNNLLQGTNSHRLNRQCSTPSPTNRTGLKYNLLSPSPTRRTFATRRSMSPISIRPSPLGPVKRKFEVEDLSWNFNFSSPPLKKQNCSESNSNNESEER